MPHARASWRSDKSEHEPRHRSSTSTRASREERRRDDDAGPGLERHLPTRRHPGSPTRLFVYAELIATDAARDLSSNAETVAAGRSAADHRPQRPGARRLSPAWRALHRSGAEDDRRATPGPRWHATRGPAMSADGAGSLPSSHRTCRGPGNQQTKSPDNPGPLQFGLDRSPMSFTLF